MPRPSAVPPTRQYRHIEPEPPRRALRGVVLVVLLAAVAALGVLTYLLFVRDRGPSARSALEGFAAAWSRGDDAGAARATNTPAVALKALRANRAGLDGARLHATVLSVKERGDSATSRLRLVWSVPRFGRFAYTSEAALLRGGDDRWRVAWDPRVVHAGLDAGTRLGTAVDRPARAQIVDRRGRAIVTPRAVVHVGVEHDKVSDPDATAAAVAGVLAIDARAYARAIRGAGPKQFVEAVTLRERDYVPVRARLRAIPGVQTLDDTAPLAPTRGFARALLGTVAPATAEQLKTLGGDYGPGASVGQFGLQARFERRLAGTPTRKVVVRLSDGEQDHTLVTHRGTPSRALRTTLDIDVQTAAERALGNRSSAAALVVVKPSTGDVLAVVNRPTNSAFDRAIGGGYAPGSTFKVISTAALLRTGLRPDDTVACRPTITVGGRTFKNFEGEAGGPVPFAQDFAQSCNTAFISLAGRLSASALPRAARSFGLGRAVKLPVTVAPSQVPAAKDRVEHAAEMIGQGRIVASPLAMAGVAATVAAGRWHAPRLVASDPHVAGAPLLASTRDTLRSLMRRVVTSGTGTALSGVPGTVIGKSGTAEFGSGNPPPTHAWFIATRDDLAVAVLVERGRSGGSVAAPIAARFFSALDSGSASG
jgi:cell division protein FtsI/penicillin-binding protein 2